MQYTNQNILIVLR